MKDIKSPQRGINSSKQGLLSLITGTFPGSPALLRAGLQHLWVCGSMQTESDITVTAQVGANHADPGMLRNQTTTVYGEEMSSLCELMKPSSLLS